MLKSTLEYTEIVVLLAWTVGLGCNKKGYGYIFKMFKLECCEFKSV